MQNICPWRIAVCLNAAAVRHEIFTADTVISDGQRGLSATTAKHAGSSNHVCSLQSLFILLQEELSKKR